MEIKKVAYYNENKFYWKEGDLHTSFGMLKEIEIKKANSGSIIKSNTGKDFLILEATIQDNLEKLKRGPAIILLKDSGPIISHSNLTKESKVLEAGTGSASLTIQLARFCKEVISYEKNSEFLKLAEKNIKSFELKNVILKEKDIREKIEEENIDTIILDMPNPQEALENCYKSLKPSGYLVTYLPTINQVDTLVKSATQFLHEKTIEVLEREWYVEPHRLRPKSQMIAHTAFLTFLRKI